MLFHILLGCIAMVRRRCR